MDVPQDSIVVAYGAQAHGAEVTDLGAIGTGQGDLEQMIHKLPSTATHLIFVSEAGPCGSGLSRDFMQTGDDGGVVAPSLSPQTPGDRVTPDRRDAAPRARLARSGDLTLGGVKRLVKDPRASMIDLDTPQSGHQTPWLRRSFGLDELLN